MKAAPKGVGSVGSNQTRQSKGKEQGARAVKYLEGGWNRNGSGADVLKV